MEGPPVAVWALCQVTGNAAVAADASAVRATWPLLIKEIIIDVVGESLALVIHWQGGDHAEMKVKKNKVGQTRWTTDAGVAALGAAGTTGRGGALIFFASSDAAFMSGQVLHPNGGTVVNG